MTSTSTSALAEWTCAVRGARVGGYLQLLNAADRKNPLGVGRTESVQGSFTATPPTDQSGWLPESQAPSGRIQLPLVGFRASF